MPYFRLYRSFPQWFFEKSFKYNCGYVLAICDYPTLFIAQNTTEFNDPERSKVFYAHYPSQSSFKAWVYIDQMIRAKKFVEVDYGEENN